MPNKINLTGSRLKELETFIFVAIRNSFNIKQLTKDILTEANRLAAYEPDPTIPNKTP